MGMGCTTVAVRMLGSHVSGAAGIKGLHLQKSEGARPVKPLQDQVRDMRQARPLRLHESPHAPILSCLTINAGTRSIYPDTSRPEDRGADAAKDSHHGVMASGGEAHTMGTRGEVATNGRDGGIRYTRGTASTEGAAGASGSAIGGANRRPDKEVDG